MLYSYRATYFIITFLTAHTSIILASDNDSISPINNSLISQDRQPRSSTRCYPKKAQRKDPLHTFSPEEIEASWHLTMTFLADMRKTYGSNEEHLARINHEQSKYIAAYHEVARYRTCSPTRLTRLEESASYLPMYFDTEPLVHAEQNQHYQASVDRYEALFDPRPLERLLKKNNNCGADKTESSDIFSGLTSTLPIEQNA